MTLSARALVPRASLAILGSLIVIACSAEGSTAAEIEEANANDAATSASTGKDASTIKDSANTNNKDASSDASDASLDVTTDADATPVDSAIDAPKDTGPKDAGKDTSTTGVDCPVDPIYIAKGFAAVLGSSPVMCVNKACPKSQCCVQVYGVCVGI